MTPFAPSTVTRNGDFSVLIDSGSIGSVRSGVCVNLKVFGARRRCSLLYGLAAGLAGRLAGCEGVGFGFCMLYAVSAGLLPIIAAAAGREGELAMDMIPFSLSQFFRRRVALEFSSKFVTFSDIRIRFSILSSRTGFSLFSFWGLMMLAVGPVWERVCLGSD